MSILTGSRWIARGYGGTGSSRGTVAGVRGRRSESERRGERRVTLGAGCALLVALLLVWVRLQVVHVGYDLSTARQLERKLEQEQRELGLEIATLTSPRRLEELARRRLGMQPPAVGQVVSAPTAAHVATVNSAPPRAVSHPAGPAIRRVDRATKRAGRTLGDDARKPAASPAGTRADARQAPRVAGDAHTPSGSHRTRANAARTTTAPLAAQKSRIPPPRVRTVVGAARVVRVP